MLMIDNKDRQRIYRFGSSFCGVGFKLIVVHKKEFEKYGTKDEAMEYVENTLKTRLIDKTSQLLYIRE
jgi:hypothetical protein